MPVSSGFGISKADLLRSKPVVPGTYLLVIKSLQQKPSTKNPDVTVTHVHMEFMEGEYAGVPIVHYLAENAPGMAVSFVEAVLGKKIPEDGIVITADMLNSLVGRKVKAHVSMEKTEKYGMQKRIEGFMPA